METNKNVIGAVVILIIGVLLGYGLSAMCMGNGMMGNGKGMMGKDSAMMGMGGDMKHAMGSMMAELEGKKGDAFDKAFLEGMIVHHQGAVEMSQQALNDAKHPEIKKLSENIIAAQNVEIEQMKAWLAAWY